MRHLASGADRHVSDHVTLTQEHLYDDDKKGAKGAHIGNAKADRVAKAATSHDQATTVPLAVQTARGILKSQMRNKWS